MSAKFPSLEEIDDEVAHTTGGGADNDFGDFTNNNGDDDFLARERAALGADATAFQTSEDAAVAGQSDEFAGFNASFPALEKDKVCMESVARSFSSEILTSLFFF